MPRRRQSDCGRGLEEAGRKEMENEAMIQRAKENSVGNGGNQR
jgi:hypothetical protein